MVNRVPTDLCLCLLPVRGENLPVSTELGHHLLQEFLLLPQLTFQFPDPLHLRHVVPVDEVLLLGPGHLLSPGHQLGNEALYVVDLLRQTDNLAAGPALQLVGAGTEKKIFFKKYS